jgi:hypothetical protein
MALVAVVAFAAVALLFLTRVRRKEIGPRQVFGAAVALAGPWAVCIGLLGWYNYHRFGSFTEFGTRYTLISGSYRLVDQSLLDVRRVWADLYCYLLFPPEFRLDFPYVALRGPDASLFPAGNLGSTPIAGSLVVMPFLGFLALAPLAAARAWRAGRYGFLAALTVLLAAGLIELLCVACFSAAMRYTVDFAGFLVVAALLVILDLDALCRPRAVLRWSLRSVAAAGLAAGCLFNLAISVEGQRHLPRDLAVRDRLRGIFPRLRFLDGHRTVRARVVFPAGKSAGQREPLVVTGKMYAGDFIYVRYQGDDAVTFLFDHWGVPSLEGKTVRVVPGRTYNFEAELRPADSRVACRLDGEEVLAAETQLYPTSRSNVRLGENRIGGGLFTSEVFSGRLRRE